MPRALRNLPLAVGGLATVLTLGWWWLTFGEITQARTLSLGEAGSCLVRASSLCDLAAALCTTRHPLLLAAYNPNALWISLIILITGTLAARNMDRTRRS